MVVEDVVGVAEVEGKAAGRHGVVAAVGKVIGRRAAAGGTEVG